MIWNDDSHLNPFNNNIQKIDISILSKGLYLLSFYSENSLIKTFKVAKY